MCGELENQLNQELLAGPVYQQLLADCLRAEEDYLRIRDQPSPDVSSIIERHLSLCEESGHRKLLLLFEMVCAKPSLRDA